MGILLTILLSLWPGGAGAMPSVKARLGPHAVNIQVAETDEDRSRGLMYVREMKDDHGMLFVFPDEFIPTFWMKNTLIPLAIAFIDRKFTIVDIQEMPPPKSLMDIDPPRYSSRKPAAMALEMNKEWFKRHGIKEGDKLLVEGPGPTPLLRKHLDFSRGKGRKTGLGH